MNQNDFSMLSVNACSMGAVSALNELLAYFHIRKTPQMFYLNCFWKTFLRFSVFFSSFCCFLDIGLTCVLSKNYKNFYKIVEKSKMWGLFQR